MNRSCAWTVASIGLLAACGGTEPAGAPDAGDPGDAATDSGVPIDAAPDGSPLDAAMGIDVGPVDPAGPAGCGLPAAAFCETFDDVAAADHLEARTGELDARRWSGARMQPGLNPNGAATPVRAATIPTCRADVGPRVFPGQDALVCDGSPRIQSRHLMMAAAEQSYGPLSLRARQPFDFTDRTGTIVFDVEGEIDGFLVGWPAIAITAEPSPAPSFAVEQNLENGAVPRAGLEVHFMQICGAEDRIGVHLINVFDDFEERYYYADQGGRTPTCVLTERGALNHFEVRVSRTRVEIWGTDRSEDGVRFAALTMLIGIDIALPFERGYVHISTHNHSSLKYSMDTIDAWTARWDNVGFDGPVFPAAEEHSAPDSLEPLVVDGSERRNVGYQLGDVAEGPREGLHFRDVDPEGVIAAHIALNGHFDTHSGLPVEDFILRYRLNGQAWVDYRFDTAQLALLNGPNVFDEMGTNVRGDGTGIAGAMALLLPVEPGALQRGDNLLELVTENVPTGYRAYVANVDLLLER